jgi:hypothetical protein
MWGRPNRPWVPMTMSVILCLWAIDMISRQGTPWTSATSPVKPASSTDCRSLCNNFCFVASAAVCFWVSRVTITGHLRSPFCGSCSEAYAKVVPFFCRCAEPCHLNVLAADLRRRPDNLSRVKTDNLSFHATPCHLVSGRITRQRFPTRSPSRQKREGEQGRDGR